MMILSLESPKPFQTVVTLLRHDCGFVFKAFPCSGTMFWQLDQPSHHVQSLHGALQVSAGVFASLWLERTSREGFNT